MKNILTFLVLIISFVSVKAQSPQSAIQDSAIIVNGVCGMCQKVIEKAAALPGVQEAKWDKNTKILNLKYSADKVSIESIYKAVASSGYDTEFLAAPEDAYQGLHNCCKYRDPKVLEDHK
jgi:copper chaperone CopZ